MSSGQDNPDEDVAIAEQEARSMLASGLGPVLDREDQITIHTHSGSEFSGVVEDSNIAAIVMRTDDGRLVFVPMASIDHAVIAEELEDEEPAEEVTAVETPSVGGTV